MNIAKARTAAKGVGYKGSTSVGSENGFYKSFERKALCEKRKNCREMMRKG
jgi:hypothetical protein